MTVTCDKMLHYYAILICSFSKQAPAWNEIVRRFKDNEDVAFADVNLSEQQIRGKLY